MAAAANYGGRLVHAHPEGEAPGQVTRIAYPQQSPYAQQGLLPREPASAYMGSHARHMRAAPAGYGQVRKVLRTRTGRGGCKSSLQAPMDVSDAW